MLTWQALQLLTSCCRKTEADFGPGRSVHPDTLEANLSNFSSRKTGAKLGSVDWRCKTRVPVGLVSLMGEQHPARCLCSWVFLMAAPMAEDSARSSSHWNGPITFLTFNVLGQHSLHEPPPLPIPPYLFFFREVPVVVLKKAPSAVVCEPGQTWFCRLQTELSRRSVVGGAELRQYQTLVVSNRDRANEVVTFPLKKSFLFSPPPPLNSSRWNAFCTFPIADFVNVKNRHSFPAVCN